MASLYSLPEHLVGVIYSLIDWESKRAFRSSCAAVRRAPSVMSQITSLCVSGKDMRRNAGVNPLACTPSGVRLKWVHFDSCKDIPLTDLLCPSEEGARMRVQDAVANLEEFVILQIGRSPEDRGPLKDPWASGVCLSQLPLRYLALDDIHPGDAITLLRAMSEGIVTQTLKSLNVGHPLFMPIDHDTGNAIVAAHGPFKHVTKVSIDCPATDYTPCAQLLDLKSLSVMECSGNLCDVLPHIPRLELLRVIVLPKRHQGSPLRSATLKELEISRCGLDELDAILDCACQGALPGLRKVEVLAMSVMLESTENARETGVALASKLNNLPKLAFIISGVKDLWNLDAFYELCALAPRLWRETQYLHDINALDFPTRVHELPGVIPHLSIFSITNCSSEEILGLCDVLSSLYQLCSIQYDIDAVNWAPGMGTSALSLCTQGALLLASSERKRGLKVELVVCFVNDEISEDEAENIELELSVLERSWAKTKAALESQQSPCKVTLKVSRHNL